MRRVGAIVASLTAVAMPRLAGAEAVFEVKIDAGPDAAGRVTGTGNASITIDCPGGACSRTTGLTTTYVLHAEPAAESAFAGWSVVAGAQPPARCGSSPECTVACCLPDSFDCTPPRCSFTPHFGFTTVVAVVREPQPGSCRWSATSTRATA
jgi:hypothetical protein